MDGPGPSDAVKRYALLVNFTCVCNNLHSYREQAPTPSTASLADDIHRLSDLLSPQSMQTEESHQATHALITHIALTLQKESNSLLFLGEQTTTNLVLCMQTVSEACISRGDNVHVIPLRTTAPGWYQRTTSPIHLRTSTHPPASFSKNLPGYRESSTITLPERCELQQLSQRRRRELR